MDTSDKKIVLITGSIGMEAGSVTIYFPNRDHIPQNLEEILHGVLPVPPHPCAVIVNRNLTGPNAQGRIVIEQADGSPLAEVVMKLEAIDAQLKAEGIQEPKVRGFISMAQHQTKLYLVTQEIGLFARGSLGFITSSGYENKMNPRAARLLVDMLDTLTYPSEVIGNIFKVMIPLIKKRFEDRGFEVR